jgi:hypothetical protein
MLKKLIFIALFSSVLSFGFAQDAGNDGAIKKSQYLIRSNLGRSGLSEIIATDKGSYYVSQSIGQESVIGTYSKNNHIIRQGFQQPLISAKNILVPTKNRLKAKLYPNPFKQSINVLFEDLIKEKLKVTIDNLSGGVLYSKTYPQSQLLELHLNFLPSGNYILKITSDHKFLISEIIKQ